MKKFEVLLFIMIVFFSCQEENIQSSLVRETTNSTEKSKLQQLFGEDLERLKLVALYGNYTTSIKVAQKIATETAIQMRNKEGLENQNPLVISSIEIIRGNVKEKVTDMTSLNKKMSSLPDMYLFNFKNKQGFVLMSADERAFGILAYNSKGNLGNKISNPGQGLLLKRSFYYIEKNREIFQKEKKNLITEAEEDLFQKLPKEKQNELITKGVFNKKGKRMNSYRYPIDCEDKRLLLRKGDECNGCKWSTVYDYSQWKTKEKHGPLVKTLWGQGDGYNNFVTKSCLGGSRAPVGCVAVAVGQILSYHRRPTYFKRRIMSWDKMINITEGNMFSNYNSAVGNDAKGDISHLLFRLGDNNLLKMNYNCDGSSASSSNALFTFRKCGYKNAYMTKSDHSKIISAMRSNNPIYIDGYSKQNRKRKCFLWWCWTSVSYDGGHAWVLDGYVKRQQEVIVYDKYSCNSNYDRSYSYKNSIELFHNNFGWSGSLKGNSSMDTGWYHKGLYDTNNGPDEKSNASFRKDDPENFQYKIQIITNIN